MRVCIAAPVRPSRSVKPVRHTQRPALLWLLLLATLLLPAGHQALAQTAYAGGPATLATGFSYPAGVAVDASDNLFVINNNGTLQEIPYSNGTYGSPVTVATGLSDPQYVAVDASDNLFVTNYITGTVQKIPYSNSTYGAPVTVATGLSYPLGIAIDASGNLFVANYTTGTVQKIPYSNSTYGSPVTLTTGLSGPPLGIAVDASDNLFVTNSIGEVQKIPYSNSTYGSPVTLTTGLHDPYGVAVDSSDNLFVTNLFTGTVDEILYSNSTSTYGSPITLTAGVDYLYGAAVDANDNLFVANYSEGIVQEISAQQGFASTAVGSTASTTVTVNFTFTSGGNIQAPAVLTQGATGLDFADAGTGTCTTNGTSNTYSTGDTCTVVVSFTPTRPGARKGAVVLYNSSGVVIATGYISGTSTGPLVTFSPYTQSTLTTGITNPEGMGVDGNGNLFVAAGSVVYELPYSNGSFGSPTSILSTYNNTALNSTQWVTVDGAGNVLVADGGNGRILMLSPGSSGTYTASQICSSNCNGNEIAVDGSGNIYTLSAASGAIVKETLANGSYTRSTIAISDTNNPWGIVVDAAGDIFYSTEMDGCLREIPYGGSDTLIDCNLESPQGMAIDLTGNLYFSETIGEVVEYTLSGGTYTKVATPLITGLSNSTGLLVDAYDNLYVSDTGNNKVYKLDYADAPTLSFASTQVGSTSSSNPQTVTLLNAGNAALTLPMGTTAANPLITAGFAYDSASTCDTISAAYTLAAGSSCTIAVDFDPVSAGSPVTGTATLTDNSLNVTGSTQSIALSGTATQASQTITFANPGAQTYGTPLTLSASAGSGLTVSYASSTTAVCTVSGSTVTFLTSGTCTITASQAGNTNYAAATSVSQSFTVNTESQTITFTALTSPVYYGAGPITLSATASSGLTVAFSVVSGPGTISSGGGSGISDTLDSGRPTGNAKLHPDSGSTGYLLTPTGVGTIVIAANQAGNNAYSAAPQVTQSIVVQSATPTITWTTPSAITYGASLAGALDATATLSGSTVAGTYSYKATATGGTASAVTGATVLPAGSYSLSVTFTPTNSQYTTATGDTTLTVAQASPTLALATSTGTAVLTNPVTFTATVASSAGTPTGSVSFLDGSTALGSATLSSGVATITTSSLTTGTHTITAVYAGDSNFTSVTGSPLTETVQDFDVTLSTSSGSTTSASVAPGQSAVYSLILSPVGSTTFPSTVELSASGLPTGATATFSPSSLAAGSGTTTVALTIQLPQVSAAAPATRSNPFREPLLPAAPAALALCLLPFAARLRRAGRTLWVAVLLLTAAGGMTTLSGCGSSSGFFTQPPQTYTVTITGTSGALVHSTTVSLTVQ